MKNVEKERQVSIKSKNDLLNLISQSFQTNLNIINYMERSGYQLNDSEWKYLLKADTADDKNKSRMTN
jgi:hypothetical protein